MTTTTIYWHPVRAIKEALEEDRESQAALAKRLGWAPSKLSNILNGRQRLDVDELIEIMAAQERPYSYYWEPPSVVFAKKPFWMLGQTTYRPLLNAA